MKKNLAALLLAAVCLLTGCVNLAETDAPATVYATFYPIYSLCALTLDGVPDLSVKCLTQPHDDCLRSYELSDWDYYLLVNSADAIVYGGRGLESFESTLYSLGDSGPALVSAMFDLPLYNDSDSTEATEDSGHLVGANPYLYMSVRGARKMVGNIAAGIAGLYPHLTERITAAGDAAIARLDELYEETQGICADISGERVIIMNEALIYVALEYNLTVAYWCDRESGTTFYGDKLEEVISEMKASGASVVLLEKQAPESFVKALENAGFRVAAIDLLTGYSAAEGYIDAQLYNARELAEAFEE